MCEDTAIADRALLRMRGLLGRATLPVGEGMLLMPAPSVHTAFMRFPIDVVFADWQLRVIRIAAHVVPWRTASARHARHALELPAGEAERRGVEVGDQLAIGVAEKTNFDANRPSRREPVRRREDLALPDTTEVSAIGPDQVPLSRSGSVEPAGAETNGHPPLRVLLIGDDRRFRAVATTLLERRGLLVAVAERGSLTEPSALPAADVVVLDAGSSITHAAEEVAELSALAPGLGVVFVSERSHPSVDALHFLPKWGSFDGLIRAIEHVGPQIGVSGDVSG